MKNYIWLQATEEMKEYKDGYMVTNFGRVYSVKSKKWLKLYVREHKYNCYPEFNLNGEATTYVHRCVAKLFIPRTDTTKDQVNHIDGNKSNNHVSNLEWVTQTENQRHAWDTGLHSKTEEHKQKLSESNRGNNSVLTEEKVIEMFTRFNNGIDQSELATIFQVDRRHVSAILSGKCWGYLGLKKTREVSAGGSKPKTIDNKEEILTMIKNGHTKKAVQEKFNISRHLLNTLLCG